MLPKASQFFNLLTTSSKTLSEALNWANSQKGKYIDTDGAYGAQCVDFTMAYSKYLFGQTIYGNAVDYSQINITGFTRLSKAQASPTAGDIAIWTGGYGGYGHVGIIVAGGGANFTTLEQNYNGSPVMPQPRNNISAAGGLTFWGVQRPSLSGTSINPPVTTNPMPVKPSPIDQIKAWSGRFTLYKSFRVDEVKSVNGVLKIVNYDLAGGSPVNWNLNGIPVGMIDNLSRADKSQTQVGDTVKIRAGYDNGTVDYYDVASGGVGIIFGTYGTIWMSADAIVNRF